MVCVRGFLWPPHWHGSGATVAGGKVAAVDSNPLPHKLVQS